MEGLEKILDKMGIFSILSVFVPGLIMGADMYLYLVLAKGFEISLEGNALVFSVISLLLGIVFFEVGYFVFTVCPRRDRFLHRTIKNAKANEHESFFQRSYHLKLCNYEYERVKEYIDRKIKENTNEDDSNFKDPNWEGYRVYNYCKHRLKNHETDISVAAMSRTLCAYFFISGILFLIIPIKCNGWFIFVHLLLFAVFLFRTIRIYELMYATVIKEFYQQIIEQIIE